ncbi:hypothetical protein LEN26_013622 [Aphanomyces euteiches]|nr:hypothetical protein LEN26_013622 [Aphanomyces euteiches]KAH9124564.1 hypothetical protein AeMF1_004692 [Aphanomyces euteiches]KAH9184560.1 hypothetical protein AeNC1_013464 [Aphanomyces euteiches]
MKIFVTGATGYVGSAVVKELLRAGHQVTGLPRSHASAQALAAVGAKSHDGNLEDLASLQAGAANADAVIHLGFNHDYSKFVVNGKVDGNVIRALGEALAGTNRTLVVASAFIGPESENEAPDEFVAVPAGGHPRAATELAVDEVTKSGVRCVTVRLP